jgi:allophanate hydrolase subunit 2
MGFRVLKAGAESLLVDLGRPGCRSLGVPVSGAADRRCHLLGNALLGNPEQAASLEIALAGPVLEATAEHHCVLVGAPFPFWLDGRPGEVGRTFQVKAGDVLEVGTSPRGLRCYLCVRGGFEAAVVLGSRSAFSPIRPGQELTCPASWARSRFVPELCWLRPDLGRLRLVPAGEQAAGLVGRVFRVSPALSRMGLRLTGGDWAAPALGLLSEPVCPGTVQLAGQGQLIVLGVDAQTIGGYPRVGQVIRADLDQLGQLRPGDGVEFAAVTLEQAEAAGREAERQLQAWCQRLRASWPS